MAKERKCPHCGARVWATDDVCMSCGKSLIAPEPTAPQKAPAEPSGQPPTRHERPVRSATAGMPLTERIPAFFGIYWDYFPWAVMAYATLAGLSRGLIIEWVPFLIFPYLLVTGLVGLALILWIIIDVIHQDAYLIWLFVGIFCSPFGLVAYLLLGRR